MKYLPQGYPRTFGRAGLARRPRCLIRGETARFQMEAGNSKPGGPASLSPGSTTVNLDLMSQTAQTHRGCKMQFPRNGAEKETIKSSPKKPASKRRDHTDCRD